MKVNCLCIIVLFFLMPLTSVFAQANIAPGVTGSTWDAIQTQVVSLLDTTYQVTDIVNVDSTKGAITNPYNTLSGCLIFATMQQVGTSLSLNGTMGIYKNGNVIWQSGPVINVTTSIMPTISAVRDLNNDGKVEIIISCFRGVAGAIESLWIFSWDGTRGNLINAVDTNNESVLISLASGFEYVDVNGDNTYEITGDWYVNLSDEQTQKVTYSWNGSLYGNWASTPQALPSGFYPRDKVNLTLNAIVKNIGGRFSYNYKLQSLSSSKQMINAFVLVTPPDSITNGASPVDWDFGGVPAEAVGWLAPEGFDAFIKPGFSDSSFYFETTRQPAIIQSLIRGDNGSWSSIFGDTVDYSIEQWFDEAKSNSFKTTTVGPADLPNPFVPLNYLDTLSSYATESRTLSWIKDQTTVNKYLGYFSSAKAQLQSNNVAGTRLTLQTILANAISDSTSNLSSEAYALIYYNTQYLLGQLPLPPSGFNVKLVNSTGTKLTGGTLQYYDGSWKAAVNNNDGTFSVNTTLKTVSLQMTYAYGIQTKSNVTVGSDTVVFQTVNAQVKLQNSQGSLIDTGTVQYYAGAWRNFGTTTSGVATMEMLPINYSFSMTYAFASNTKAQDLSVNPVVVFQTTNTSVQLKNSQGNLIDTGTVQYYSGAWRAFGTTTNGVTTKELLPNSYSFSMTYAFASNNKQQDIGANSTVVFQTVNAAVQLKNSQGSLIDQGTAQYYSGAWRTFGTTSGGVTTKELLPNNYSFMMTYAYASNTKQQDLNSNPTVIFQTVNTTVQLENSQGNLIDTGTVQYYSGAWRTFGTTTNGTVSLELLPNSYQFNMTYAFVTNSKTQNVGSNNIVSFSSVLATVNVTDTQNNPVNNAVVTYYSGAWRQFGNTLNGNVAKELLPANLQFRATSGSVQQNKTQDITSNPLVQIILNIPH